MPQRRWIELVAGLAAGLIGIASLAYFIVGPSYRYEQCGETAVRPGSPATPAPGQCVSGTANAIQAGEPLSAWVALGVLFLCLVGVAVGAYLDSRWRIRAGRVTLWVCSALLILGTIVSIPSVGIFLVLPTILSLAAVSASTAR